MKTVKTTAKKSSLRPLTTDEQQLWDNVVMSLIGQGQDGCQATWGADQVIAGRRVVR